MSVRSRLRELLLPPADAVEWPATIWAFCWFLCVLCSYYLIRPVRETVGSQLGQDELPWLFAATFVVMLCANPVYSMLVGQVSRRLLVHVIYRCFAVCLIVFCAAFLNGNSPWVSRAFFIWVSVFNLFAVSIFWSVLADSFRREQATRLFGFISAGGTAGGILGSYMAQAIADLGIAYLLLVPVVFLELSTWLMTMFDRSARRLPSTPVEPAEVDEPASGSFWEGIANVFASPYLLGICAMLLLAKLCGTGGYFQQTEVVRESMTNPEQRLALFARMNLAVQMVTIVFQTLFVGRMIRWWGLSTVLCILPATYAASFLGLSMTTTLAVLVVGRVAQRSVAFGVLAPAQEALFTVVPREQKYKSKAFIDTAVVRGGDVIASWSYQALRTLGLTLPALALGMLPITMIWCGVAWCLGAAAKRKAV